MLERTPNKDQFFVQLRLDDVFTEAIGRWRKRMKRYGARMIEGDEY